jgi:hypothetical protein
MTQRGPLVRYDGPRLPGRGRDLARGGEALARRQDHATESRAGDRAELGGLGRCSSLQSVPSEDNKDAEDRTHPKGY